MKTGFRLRPNVFGLILFYAVTTVLGMGLIIWLPLLAMEAMGREPAWNLSALVGIPVLFVIIFRPPFNSGFWRFSQHCGGKTPSS